MPKIVCNIEMGVLKHEVAVIDGVTVQRYELTLDEIPDFIMKHTDITEVYIHGSNHLFLEKIEHDTQKLEQNLYARNVKNFHYI